MITELRLILPTEETDDVIEIVDAAAELHLKRGLLVVGLGVVVKHRRTAIGVDRTDHVECQQEFIPRTQAKVHARCNRDGIRHYLVKQQAADR